MKILYWQVSPELKKEAKENYRTSYALSLKDKGALQIMRELTFDGVAPNITVNDIEKLFIYIENNFLKKAISGTGLELGAGPAVFSSILAKREKVDKMYAVEICQNLVEILMPKIVSTDKVIGCVGDFNNLELEDNSIDFIFDFFSLHHSDNPTLTLKECSRVLKPGGFLLALDKARPDYLNQEDLNKLLDKEYEDDFKVKFSIPTSKKLTRKMNGEHEYRLREWQEFFLSCGFSSFNHHRLDQCVGNEPIRLIKTFLAYFPPAIQIKVSFLLPKRKHLGDLSWQNRVFTSVTNNFRKEMSLMIAYK